MALAMDQNRAQAANTNVERRASQRRRVLKGATLTFNRGCSAFECVVRNQSDGGARLSMEQTFALPMSFSLAITVDGTAQHARVVWRSPTEVGVRFDNRPR